MGQMESNKIKITISTLMIYSFFSTSVSASASDLVSAKSIAIEKRTLPFRSEECQDCHINGSSSFISKKSKTKLEHQKIKSIHGQKILACNFCHDKNNHNFLRTSSAFPASFENSSPVCQQCHAEEFKDWSQGLHGKRQGGWSSSRKKTQKQCISCHNPHSVKFEAMKAMTAPHRPPFGIPKENLKNK